MIESFALHHPDFDSFNTQQSPAIHSGTKQSPAPHAAVPPGVLLPLPKSGAQQFGSPLTKTNHKGSAKEVTKALRKPSKALRKEVAKRLHLSLSYKTKPPAAISRERSEVASTSTKKPIALKQSMSIRDVAQAESVQKNLHTGVMKRSHSMADFWSRNQFCSDSDGCTSQRNSFFQVTGPKAVASKNTSLLASLVQWWKGSPSQGDAMAAAAAGSSSPSLAQSQEFAHAPHPQEVTNKPKKELDKQDPAHTRAAALEDSERRIFISDAFLDLERQDEDLEGRVKRQDAAARAEAKVRHPVLKDTPEALKKRQVHFSHVFSSLEAQDKDVEKKMAKTADDVEYSRLSHVQADSMQTLLSELSAADKQQRPQRPPLTHSDKDPEAKLIHEPWLAMQKMDEKTEGSLKRQPDLRLLQRGSTLHH